MKYSNLKEVKKSLLAGSLNIKLFHLGLIILPSSPLLSTIFFLTSSFNQLPKRKDKYWFDKSNYLLVLISILMIVGCFNAYSGWLAWVGLANWIPFFWCYWAFQPFLLTAELRQGASYCLLIGTFPVFVTGLGQIWFDWSGPWQILNGLIIWFVSAGGNPDGRLSGLFDYANITAAWLVVIWPLSLASLLRPSLHIWRRIIALLFAIAIVVSIVLTDSRNGWAGLIAALPTVIGISSWRWLLPLIMLSISPILFAVLPGIDSGLQDISRKIVPEALWTRLNDVRFGDVRPVETTRMSQWKEAYLLIIDKPWLGWGAAAFSVLYPLKKGFWHGHSHNLPLELAVSHGVLVSFLINIFVIMLLITSFKKNIFMNKNLIFERAWWTSFFLLVCMHSTDITFFDSRINLVGWILLSGLRCMTYDQKQLSRVNPSSKRVDN